MTAINNALAQVSMGEAQRFGNLKITPQLAQSASVADYLVLSEAQVAGLAILAEISEAGSVPTLLLQNNAPQALFLLDGQELAGAKQNNIIKMSQPVTARNRL